MQRARAHSWQCSSLTIALAACCALYSSASQAQSVDASSGEEYPLLSFPEVHAFVSQGFILSSKNDYLADSERGSFEFSEIGINFTKHLTHDLRAGVQLFARDLGPQGDYRVQADWFYLDYRFADWLGLRAGRTKVPFGLYNEINDADMARVPILLPQSVYPNDHRDYLLAQTGGEIYGNVELGAGGELEYRAYGGTIFIDTSSAAKGPVPLTEFGVPYLFGGRLMWMTPVDGLQAGASFQALRLDSVYTLPPATAQMLVMAGAAPADFNGMIGVKIPLKLWVASIEYAAHDLLLAGEYGRWIGDVESDTPTVFPSSRTVNERFYAMAAYRVTPWFTPGIYHSVFFLNVKDRNAPGGFQHDFALSLRFDLTDNWLVKAEGHVMHGTGALDRGLNDGKELGTLPKDWLLLMLKTTAYF